MTLLSPGTLLGPSLLLGDTDDSGSLFLCTIAQINAFLGKAGDSEDYTDAAKKEARAIASEAIEQACGVAFAPRSETIRLDGGYSSTILLPRPKASAVTAITAGATVLVSDALEQVSVLDGGVVYWDGAYFPAGRGNVSVTYTHGYDPTPTDVSRAVALLAASMLKDGPYDDRGYGVTEDGASIRLLTAGVQGAWFSIPEVQAVVQRYRFVEIGVA